MCYSAICLIYFQVLPELPVIWDRKQEFWKTITGDQSPLGPDAIKLNHNNRVPAQTTQKLNARRNTTDEPFRQTGGGRRRTGTGSMDLITIRTKVKWKGLKDLWILTWRFLALVGVMVGKASVSLKKSSSEKQTCGAIFYSLSSGTVFWVTVVLYSLSSMKLIVLRLKPYNKRL